MAASFDDPILMGELEQLRQGSASGTKACPGGLSGILTGQTDWFHVKVEAQANEQTADG